MARRRRRGLIEDDDDFSSGSDGEQDDEVFGSDGLPRKRKRKGGGAFGDGDEEDGEETTSTKGLFRSVLESQSGRKATTDSSSHTRRPQAFVPASSTSAVQQPLDEGSEDDDEEDDEDEDDEHDDLEQDTIPQPPDDPDDEADGFTPASFFSARSGIGSKGNNGATRPATSFVKSGAQRETASVDLPSSRAGIGAGQGEASSARGGIGSSSRRVDDAMSAETSSRGGIGSSQRNGDEDPTPASRAGIGSQRSFEPEAQPSRGGIGSSNGGPSQPSSFTPSTSGLPTAFAPPTRPQPVSSEAPSSSRRSFLPNQTQSPHTSIKFGTGLGGGFNPAAYLASMGWTGGGLGMEGEGMVNPIEVQLRPERAGIAFGGRKERTKAEREEAKRRGEDVGESDEEESARGKKGKSRSKPKEPAPWTRAPSTRKPRKPKIEHRTYEEIIEEAGGGGVAPSEVIMDARGGQVQQVSSIAQALSHHPVPTSDSTFLPELRHNLRLICENTRLTLDSLAKEGASIVERRRWMKRELEESTRRAARDRVEIERIKGVLALTKELDARGKKAMVDRTATLESAFADLVVGEKGIQTRQSENEIREYALDEALVGAIAPLFKRLMADWQPLEEAEVLVDTLREWSKALRVGGQPVKALATRGGQADEAPTATEMRPIDALLWHTWMPRVRSALNNEWKVHHPRAAVALLSAWRPVLPRYLWDNLIDQILLPKINRAVHEWDSKRSKSSLHHILFPWLPVLEDRIDDIMSEAKRAVRGMIKSHSIGKADDEKLAKDLGQWREFFSRSEWDSMLLTLVMPKLASYLKSQLVINPASQELAPLQTSFIYLPLIRQTYFSRLLEESFFPKWLETLHSWLIQPNVDVGQVAQWYTWWKEWFTSRLDGEWSGIDAAFKTGIQLINDALSMDEDERSRRLSKPSYKPLSRAEASEARKKATLPTVAPQPTLTIKLILETKAASHDLILLSLNRVHTNTGSMMYKLAPASSPSSANGVAFYIEDDVVYVEERDARSGIVDYRPIDVDGVVALAAKGRRA